MGANVIEQTVIAKIRELPSEKQQEVLNFVNGLESAPKRPLKSLAGLWADHNGDITEEDIAQLRKEMWGNFPRDDF